MILFLDDKIMKTSPLQFAKKSLNTGANVLSRLHKSASVAGLSALRVAKGEQMDAYLLKDAFMQMGVTYIKLGQFIASTPSLFPREYVRAFADCLDATPPVPFATMREVLADELAYDGRELDDIFKFIDPVPLASASIAQVHQATLTDGRSVVLKIQKPNVGAIMQTDLGVLHGAFWMMERALPMMKIANLAPIIDEIRIRMSAETDFLAEACHIDKFRKFLDETGRHHITAPKVHHDLSTKRVLVMDLLVGKSLVDEGLLASLGQSGHTSTKQVMADVLDTWFLSLMMTGEFHADLHAGNLMYLDDGRIGFLDFGLMGRIKPSSLRACFSLVQSLQAGDYHGMAQAMVDIGMTHSDDKIKTEQLADDLNTMMDKVHGSPQDTDNLNLLMLELVEIGKRYGVHFPRDFTLLTKQLLYFDRFMVTLAPDMELFEGERLKLVKEQKAPKVLNEPR